MKRKGFTAYTIVTTLGEETALVVIVLLGLPLLGIHIPVWGLAIMMAAWAAYSYFTYWLCQRVLFRKTLVGPETLVGAEGKTSGRLAPKGYVRVQGESWKAVAADVYMDKDEEVIVVGLRNLNLLVRPLGESDKNNRP